MTGNMKANEEVPQELECGTSLAEWEHAPLPSTSISGNHTNYRLTVGESGKDGIQTRLNKLKDRICSDIVGDGNNYFTSPYESPSATSASSDKTLNLPLVYCDHTASSRPLSSVENYISDVCLPYYGNTHTNTSITGSQSTAFVAEARQIVAESVNARISGKANIDVVLFTGSGATSCVQLLIDCMGLTNVINSAKESRPVVFCGPFEHHSNLLPWRESGCEIVMIPESPLTGDVDLKVLEHHLSTMRSQNQNRLLMGTFTAASNVTGRVSDVNAISALLHQYNALAFFDYATGAPYLDIDMNPNPARGSNDNIAKDAIFISPHKMIGGVNTCGVLVVKKHLVNQVQPPARSGGGTVFYVSNSHHRFLSNRIERYEGGTPNIVGIIRTGMTFLVKRRVHDEYLSLVSQNGAYEVTAAKDNDGGNVPPTLMECEFQTYERVVKTLKETAPNLILLGTSHEQSNSNSNHLPIFSFLIRCGNRFLHYNYVCAILNDIFGIQSRGGCQCAGPFSQRLLGLSTMNENGEEVPNKINEEVENALLYHKEKAELLRPGYTRLSLPFKGLREIEIDYVLKALAWTAKNGWAFLAQYRCNHRTGEWRHHIRQGKPLGDNRRWISHYDILSPASHETSKSVPNSNDESILKSRLDEALRNADLLLKIAKKDKMNISQALNMGDANGILGSEDGQESDMGKLRWYVYPKECAKWLKEGLTQPPGIGFDDEVYGALRPRECCSPIAEYVQSSSQAMEIDSPKEETTDATIKHAPQKRKFEDDNGTTTNIYEEKKNVKSNEPTESLTKELELFQFRDGEYHSGSAPLDEIEEGFNDGELSEKCEIFSVKDDTWVGIQKFLDSLKKNETCEQKVDCATCVKPMTESKVSSVPDDKRMIPAIGSQDNDNNTPATGPKKKPARDSSSWGRSTANSASLHVNPSVKKTEDATNPGKIDETKSAEQTRDTQNPPKMGKKKKKAKNRPPPKMMRAINQAILQFNMIEEGDNLLLGLSGGKDSLSLLHCLLELQRKLPVNFSIQVCTIDPMTPSFDPSPLIPYVRDELGLTYHYIRDDIVARAAGSGKDGKVVSSLCSFCARMKRGNLYTTARRNNCNKLVLAQHLDDCAESMMMSIMHNGFLRTMKANYKINAGDLAVIRPMVYCRESLMTEYAKSAGLPVINENCPACFEEPKERDRVKKLLSREETLYPNLYDNLRRALIPLMHEDSTSIMRYYTEETVAKTRKEPGQKKKFFNYKPKVIKPTDTTVEDEKKSNEDGVSLNKMLEESVKNETPEDGIDPNLAKSLADASEQDLVAELARRRSSKFKLYGSMKRLGEDEDDDDPTGQVCTLNGDKGSIPCYELME